jgi:hypothetical protein
MIGGKTLDSGSTPLFISFQLERRNMALLDQVSLRLGHARSAVLSGALTEGSFPWERKTMTTQDIITEYGSRGISDFQKYRQASEKGIFSLKRVRSQCLGTFQPPSKSECRTLNKQLEAGTISFSDILEKWGNNGGKALQKYREQHYYEPAEISGKGYLPPQVRDFSQFRAKREKDGVHYFMHDHSGTAQRAAFVDTGAKIEISEGKNKTAIEAALELAAQKWNGEFTVAGTDQYKALCVKIAVERNWKLVNPELHSQIEEAKARMAERSPSTPSIEQAKAAVPAAKLAVKPAQLKTTPSASESIPVPSDMLSVDKKTRPKGKKRTEKGISR